jgi:hypothetical protein
MWPPQAQQQEQVQLEWGQPTLELPQVELPGDLKN